MTEATAPAAPVNPNPLPPGLLGNGARVAGVEHRAVDMYQTITQGTTPYLAQVGGKVYTFNKRPNARLQLKAMGMLGKFRELRLDDEDTELTEAKLAGIAGMVDDLTEVLKATLADPDDLDELLDLVDLETIAELTSKVMEKMMARPTNGSSASRGSAPPTTSGTGSPAPVSA
jgi:hypothetical protein